jgi:hypothetical protein
VHFSTISENGSEKFSAPDKLPCKAFYREAINKPVKMGKDFTRTAFFRQGNRT